ncbi:glycerol-3-phosphate acyltransferase 1 [Amborella trichopoda]|uniref:Phospholipid/glycerol acyltransferase domain-containing protein n=1 Tax=Amborella trichopoda TaxID=13333 RepID=W1P0G0_AMBTC|nr:glycerol-3-phosphate acyltransferase 1 [Amborella trichopoda]ERN03317.1 hypothetical protein AMTR_s00003p00236080 [Amborella trichopoda]|eukprot:XP_006841642.1 glycerol-3-phosphate acyltransferase 1 [Amborella trichopoda]
MVSPKLLNCLSHYFLPPFFSKVVRKLRNQYLRKTSSLSPQYPPASKCALNSVTDRTLVCDINGALLRSASFFPYFMLVAFEAGGIFRALFLTLVYPFLFFVGRETAMKVMIFISFCGLKQSSFRVGKSVLPKFFLEDLHSQCYEMVMASSKTVVITSVPKIMVEEFLEEYLGVEVVLGTELHFFHGYFTGFVGASGLVNKQSALKRSFAEIKPDIGVGSLKPDDCQFLSLCKEAYLVNSPDYKNSYILPREKYPKPLIFHDGRLAFRPTSLASLAMFLWLPIALPLAIIRTLIGLLLPYKVAIIVGFATGMRFKLKNPNQKPSSPILEREKSSNLEREARQGVLYVCTHRTLLDPLYLATALNKPLTAVTYSLSRVSEILAPIKTVRLTRERKEDGERMKRLLREGDLVVCPEGTTCREPYLLRFSPLFAELTDEIVPVAINVTVSMFYGTSASGFKCLDPLFFLMNPFPNYEVEVLEKLPFELSCSSGKSSFEVANYVQKKLGEALGFECTTLTRKDKYLMLAGNEGIVGDACKRPNRSG